MEVESEVFVGRKQELDVLRHALSMVKRGKGVMVFISGFPGMGKTMLVNTFLSEVEADPHVSVWKVKLEEETSTEDSFFVFKELFEKIFVHEEKQRAKKEFANDLFKMSKILLNLVPLVGSALGEAVGQLNESFAKRFAKQKANEEPYGAPTEAKRFASTFDVLCSVMEKVGCGTVFIDDIQWIDVSSVNMLRRLSKKIDSLPLLLICTYRPGELQERKDVSDVVNKRILAGGARLASPVKKVELKALDENQLNMQVSALYGRQEFDSVFVKQLVKLLEDRGIITDRGEFHRSYCQMLCMALGGVPIFFYSIDKFSSFNYPCQLFRMMETLPSFLSRLAKFKCHSYNSR